MELQLKTKLQLLFAAILTLSACSKSENQADTANQRFIQSMDWNENHPWQEIIAPSDEYSVVAMGDSHVGSTKNLDSFFRIAKEEKASAVVMAGDLTTGNPEDYMEFENHLPEDDALPLFFLAGNHDLFSNGWEEFYRWFGSSTYIFSIKTPVASDLYICLETGGGTLGDKQLKWLTRILQTIRPDYRRCIVITHNNFFRNRHTDSTNPVIEELTALLELFTINHVDMVVTGHDHKHDAEVFGLTTYIVMDALKDGLSNAGYFQLKVKNGIIGYNFEKF
jgi:predicted phosphodiesterase